ncbi:MAG: N-acetyltransferase [Anaerocolumna sp.]|jgi:predicted GNAT family acetyltransferase|nr:N-acetyltransferase [Anaerocolumna sp.]
MEFKHESNRIYLNNAEGEMVAEVTFPALNDDVVNIIHTFVDDSLRGQGIAGKLMEETVQQLKRTEKKAILSCSYAVNWFEKNPEYSDLISKE